MKEAPVLTSRKRYPSKCRGQSGLSFNRGVGEGIVGALEGETSNFAWGQSKDRFPGGDIGVGP